jgi:hypothetical protein
MITSSYEMETPQILPIETNAKITIRINGRSYTVLKEELDAIKTQQKIPEEVTVDVTSKCNCTVNEFLKIIEMVSDMPITKLTINIEVNGLGSHELDRKIMEVVKTNTSIVDFNITYNTFINPLGSFVSYVPEDFDYYIPEFDPEVFATIKEMLERNRSLVGITREVPNLDDRYTNLTDCDD